MATTSNLFNNNSKQQINHNNLRNQKAPQKGQRLSSINLKETGSSRENLLLQLEQTTSSHLNLRKHNVLNLNNNFNRFQKAIEIPKQIEIITIADDDIDDDETEIDEDYTQNERIASTAIARTDATAVNDKDTVVVVEEDRVLNFEETVLANVFWEPHYACDSFEYDKRQELKYLIKSQDLDISPQFRAELVDWLVAIQVRYSLDHEPLYMAVKLADHYLTRKFISEDDYILLYLTTMFISAKFDERQSCITMSLLIKQARARYGVKYTKKQIINLEVDLLKTLNFDLRFPLSYGFLRRFARCTRSDMKTINLARYILESSLMDYDMIEILESEIAAGSLLLAHEMLQHTGAWDATARHYTGYNEKQLYPLIIRLNRTLLKFSRKKTAIKKKYSHELFMEVAKIPPIILDDLYHEENQRSK